MMQSPFRSAAAAVFTLAIGVTPMAPTSRANAEPPSRPAPAAGQQCFYARNISNYIAASDRLIYLRVGVNDVYRLDLMMDCPELSFRQNIEFQRAERGSNICSAIDLTVTYRQNGARRICPVSEMRKLSPEEVAALPKRDRP
jgi:hypothetical protein